MLEVPFPLAGASDERNVGPSARSETEPWTSETRRTCWTLTVVVQLLDCGVVSSFAASSSTVYEPTGTFASTLKVPVAVPPSLEAGVTPVSAIEPAPGAGVTEPSVSEVTVPSRSVAEIGALPAVPCRTESDTGQERTTPL